MNKLHKKYKDELMYVEWRDANQSEIDDEYLNSFNGEESGKDLLVLNKTYGKIGAVLKDVVIIIHEESEHNKSAVDATFIPRNWIVYPKDLSK